MSDTQDQERKDVVINAPAAAATAGPSRAGELTAVPDPDSDE